MQSGEAKGPRIVSKGEFARLRGCVPSYVTKLCRPPSDKHPAGALWGSAALLADGRINVELAEQVLGPAVPSPAAARRAAAAAGLGSERQGRGGAVAPTAPETRTEPPPVGALPLGAALAGVRILDDKARRERALADSAEMAAAKERRELVAAEAVADPQFDVVRIMRNRVLAVPEALAEELASLTEPRAMAARLLDALEAALRDASADFARLQAEEEAEAARLEAELAGEGAPA